MISIFYFLSLIVWTCSAFHTHKLRSMESIGVIEKSIFDERHGVVYALSNSSILSSLQINHDGVGVKWKTHLHQESEVYFVMNDHELITLSVVNKEVDGKKYDLPILQTWSKNNGLLIWETSLTRDLMRDSIHDLQYDPASNAIYVLFANTFHLVKSTKESPIVWTWSTNELTLEQQKGGVLFLSGLIPHDIDENSASTYRPVAFGCLQNDVNSNCKASFILNVELSSGNFHVEYLEAISNVKYNLLRSTKVLPPLKGCGLNEVILYTPRFSNNKIEMDYNSQCSKSVKSVEVSTDFIDSKNAAYAMALPDFILSSNGKCSHFKGTYQSTSKTWEFEEESLPCSDETIKVVTTQAQHHASRVQRVELLKISELIKGQKHKGLLTESFGEAHHVSILSKLGVLVSFENGLLAVIKQGDGSIILSNQAYALTHHGFVTKSEQSESAKTESVVSSGNTGVFANVLAAGQYVGLISNSTFRRNDQAFLVTYNQLDGSGRTFRNLGLLVHFIPMRSSQIEFCSEYIIQLKLQEEIEDSVTIKKVHASLLRRSNHETLVVIAESATHDLYVWEIPTNFETSTCIGQYSLVSLLSHTSIPKPSTLSEDISITYTTGNTLIYSQGSLMDKALIIELHSEGSVYSSEQRHFVHHVDQLQNRVSFYEVSNDQETSKQCNQHYFNNNPKIHCKVASVSSVYQWDSVQERILRVEYPNKEDSIHSKVSVLGDDNVLVKYLNPNLMIVYTQSVSGTADESYVTINLMDTVAGRIIKKFRLESATGPLSSVLMENILFTSYWNNKAKRCEISSIALYEGVIGKYDFIPNLENIRTGKLSLTQKNEQMKSSFGPPQLITVERSYIVPKMIVDLQHTISKYGITNKNLLATMDSGEIFSIDLRSVHPRRPLSEPTPAEKEEGLSKYSPLIFLNPLASVTKAMSSNDRGLTLSTVSSPSSLESSTNILSFGYGSDVNFFAHYPAQEFDSLPMDFNYPMLVLLLLALGVAVLFLRQMSRRSALNRLWV